MKRYEKCFRPLRFTAPAAGWLIIHLPRRRLQGKDALFFYHRRTAVIARLTRILINKYPCDR